MKKPSVGSRLLETVLVTKGYSQYEAAQVLQLGPNGQQNISNWLAGATPYLKHAVALRDAFGIPVDAWLQRKKRSHDATTSKAA